MIPLSRLVAVTLTPGMTALFWSVMVPFKAALATSTCPDAGMVQSAMTSRIRKAKRLVCIGGPPTQAFPTEFIYLRNCRKNAELLGPAANGETFRPTTAKGGVGF